ncbi:conserved hypothetical protein [Xenorhabdus nematophila F1]|nr:conserved hypothetical protein [Xenorhabdus nematophila F1]
MFPVSTGINRNNRFTNPVSDSVPRKYGDKPELIKSRLNPLRRVPRKYGDKPTS